MRLVGRLVLCATLLAFALPAAAASPAPPPPVKAAGGGGGSRPGTKPGTKPSKSNPKKKPAKKKNTKKKKTVPPKNAVRGFVGGSFLTNDTHPYSPETWFTIGLDYEQPAGNGFTYAPGFRWNQTAVDTDLYEGIVTARYKFGKERDQILPYALAGAGAAVMNTPGGTEFGAELRAGLGASLKINNSFRVGFEVAGVYLLMANDPGNGLRDEIGLLQLAIVPEYRF